MKLQGIMIIFFIIMGATICAGSTRGILLGGNTNHATRPSQEEYSHRTTRRQAIIDYVMALYKPEEGTFYGYLRDWPTDPRIHSYPDIPGVYYPYRVLEYLNYTSEFNWENTTSFLLSLINDESKYDIVGPINSTEESSCDVVTCAWAVELFSKLGIINELDLNAIVDFVKWSQMPSGGFKDCPWYELMPSESLDLIDAQSALFTVYWLNRTDEINSARALDFVLSCYKGNGFSFTPTSSEIDVYDTPLGLLCLSYLDGLSHINREAVISFVLSNFDNVSGHAIYEHIVNTERLIWSLDLLGALDRINQDAVVDWVIACQSTWQGAFISDPDADPLLDERLEYARAALHILQMLGRLDVLDEEITLIMYPEHVIPQAYYDFINEHFPTSTTTANGPAWVTFPHIDIVAVLAENAIALIIAAVLLMPLGLVLYADRMKRIERARRKKERKRKKKH